MKTSNNFLNPLQIAYIIGRTHYLPLGGVGMHDFRVFRGKLDGQSLQKSLRILVEKHVALRTMIDGGSFTQTILEKNDTNFTEIDFSNLTPEEAELKTNQLIELYSHHVHDLTNSPWHIWLIQLPECSHYSWKSILLTSFDALILDGYAISIILEELFYHYNNITYSVHKEINSLTKINKTQPSKINIYENNIEDETFWKNKIKTMGNTVSFPWKKDLESINSSRYNRRTATIDKQCWDKLSLIAAKQPLLPNSLLNGIIFDSLSNLTNNTPLYVAIPISLSLYQDCLSNHSTVIPIIYDQTENKSLFNRVSKIQSDTFEALEHISFSGIEIARLICDQIKTSVPFPIVLTNGLSWRLPPHEDYINYYSGQTQTPQIAMDIRLTFSHNKDLVIDIDYATEAIELAVIDSLLISIKNSIESICQNYLS